jgi:large conductance mechanosensitive channel
MSGFKAFLLRGNLVELAVAFIMGGAFATVVTAFTALILGIVAKIAGGNPDFTKWKPGHLPVGAFLTALIAFVILAAVVYFFVVLPYQKAKDRFFPTEVQEEGVSEDIALLTQIRDALVAQGGTTGGTTGGIPPAGV